MATGSTMRAATRRMPTTRMAATTVTAARAASRLLSPSTGSPPTRDDSSSSTTANRARPQTATAVTITTPEAGHDQHVLPGDGEDAAEQVGEQAGVEGVGQPDEHHAGGDARVEEQGQGQVARRLAPRPQPLEAQGPGHGHHQGRPHRPDAEEEPGGHPGEGQVADAVAQQRQPPLDEERADQGGAGAHHHARPAGPAACSRGRTGRGARRAVTRGLPATGAGRPARRPGGRRCRPAPTGGPSKTIFCLRTSTRSRAWATAPSSWDTSRTPAPCSSTRWVRESAKRFWDSASTPATGSSRTSSSGSLARALAMNDRCCWPPGQLAHRPVAEVAAGPPPPGRGRWRRGRRAPSVPASRCGPGGRRPPPPAPTPAPPGPGPGAGGRSPAATGRGAGGGPRRRPAPSPRSGRRRPRSTRRSVDLPEPLGPTRATNSPASRQKVTPSRTTSSP